MVPGVSLRSQPRFLPYLRLAFSLREGSEHSVSVHPLWALALALVWLSFGHLATLTELGLWGSHSMGTIGVPKKEWNSTWCKEYPWLLPLRTGEGLQGGAGRADAHEQDRSTSYAVQPHHMYGLGPGGLPKGYQSFAMDFCSSDSDKNIHRFAHMYAEYLDPLRLQQDEVNLMEIGLREGDSVKLWLESFPAGKVYGIEYDPRGLAKMNALPERVKVFNGDQANATFLSEVVTAVEKEVGGLDFIVDDGGHTMTQQITSFTHLFPLVRPGGFYFIEDLQTSYYEKHCTWYWNGEQYCYGGGPPGKKNTTIDLIKSFIDVLNADFMEDHEKVDEIGSAVYSVNKADSLLGSVQCWRNMCALRRKFLNAYF